MSFAAPIPSAISARLSDSRAGASSASSLSGRRVCMPPAVRASFRRVPVTRAAATDTVGSRQSHPSFMERINDFLFSEEFADEWYEGEDPEHEHHQHEYMEEDDSAVPVQEYEVLKLEPQGFEDVWDVAMQALRERRCVILSTRHMDVINAQRAVDFLAGSTQILYGHVEALGDGIFMFAPSTAEVHVVGDAPAHQESDKPSLFDFIRRRG